MCIHQRFAIQLLIYTIFSELHLLSTLDWVLQTLIETASVNKRSGRLYFMAVLRHSRLVLASECIYLGLHMHVGLNKPWVSFGEAGNPSPCASNHAYMLRFRCVAST